MGPLQPDFEQLYRGELRYVWHLLARFGVLDKDLEDVAQEVFVVMYRRLSAYDPSRPVRPWLTGIAFRVASEYRRRPQQKRELLALDDDAGAAAPQVAGDAAADIAMRDLMRRALAQLDWDRRSVFVLHDIEGLSVPEIGDMLEVSVNTLYSRLKTARTRFEDAIRALEGIAGEEGEP